MDTLFERIKPKLEESEFMSIKHMITHFMNVYKIYYMDVVTNVKNDNGRTELCYEIVSKHAILCMSTEIYEHIMQSINIDGYVKKNLKSLDHDLCGSKLVVNTSSTIRHNDEYSDEEHCSHFNMISPVDDSIVIYKIEPMV